MYTSSCMPIALTSMACTRAGGFNMPMDEEKKLSTGFAFVEFHPPEVHAAQHHRGAGACASSVMQDEAHAA